DPCGRRHHAAGNGVPLPDGTHFADRHPRRGARGPLPRQHRHRDRECGVPEGPTTRDTDSCRVAM
ncbi:MAG: hypothetical protein AVDCRST_MAG88-4167, partial [uncultured Thermomicrobiales bacterium]